MKSEANDDKCENSRLINFVIYSKNKITIKNIVIYNTTLLE